MDFLQLPEDHIRQFLTDYGQPIPTDKLQRYNAAIALLNQVARQPDAQISEAIVDWYIAFTLKSRGQTVSRMKASEIFTGSDADLILLAQTLELTTIERNRIIRILDYLGVCLLYTSDAA